MTFKQPPPRLPSDIPVAPSPIEVSRRPVSRRSLPSKSLGLPRRSPLSGFNIPSPSPQTTTPTTATAPGCVPSLRECIMHPRPALWVAPVTLTHLRRRPKHCQLCADLPDFARFCQLCRPNIAIFTSDQAVSPNAGRRTPRRAGPGGWAE